MDMRDLMSDEEVAEFQRKSDFLSICDLLVRPFLDARYSANASYERQFKPEHGDLPGSYFQSEGERHDIFLMIQIDAENRQIHLNYRRQFPEDCEPEKVSGIIGVIRKYLEGVNVACELSETEVGFEAKFSYDDKQKAHLLLRQVDEQMDNTMRDS